MLVRMLCNMQVLSAFVNIILGIWSNLSYNPPGVSFCYSLCSCQFGKVVVLIEIVKPKL